MIPKLFQHAFNSDSKSVTFGWFIAMSATGFYAAAFPDFTVEVYQRMLGVGALLIAGKLGKEVYLEGRAPKEPKNAALPPA